MHYYEYRRAYTPCRQECEDFVEAIGCAWADIEGDAAWPGRILDGEKVLWEQSGPFNTRDSLVKFASENGVQLRDT